VAGPSTAGAEATSVRILESDNNRRGDLFGRFMADLFVALGYEQPRLNVHKSGRELDISANHRLEAHRVIAECKATAEPVGGDDLNKFVGALDAEYDDKRPVIGYFISLAGFRETANEQEMRRRTKIVTLSAPELVSQLIQGRILIAKDRATEISGRLCSGLDSLVLDNTELLAHERGWIWVIYYTQSKLRTHFALIHADGTPLTGPLTDEVIAADRDCGGQLHSLSCLNPHLPHGADTDSGVADALKAYAQYLANECGFIQLDGLPADSDVGSRRLRLENLFIPLHLDINTQDEKKRQERQSVGAALSSHPRLALLASPGGGKSTLLKRLAVAYTDPDRQRQITDDLPQRDWLPLFIRCRELRDLTRGSFGQLIDAISDREHVRQHAAAFRAHVDRALFAGRVLLLVDGLDEISNPGDRAAFVCTLRTTLQAYPGTAIVVTSREAGFRHVAAHISPLCAQATLSPFDTDDIRRLTVAWHREVIGESEKVRIEAEQFAAMIVRNDRIRRLAVNPLLLITLLLVKRWVGSLPIRRAILYDKAVEVLLMTWNIEGHEPIPEEEALPQLCYVAFSMTLNGLQKISQPRLAALLQGARNALPAELGYVKDTVDQFIRRIEERSSLLMMTGYDVEDGRLVEFFEFRHLTFQEFLTARAVVEGWHPDRNKLDTVVKVLEPRFRKEEWREIIPLAAVLGGKSAEPVLEQLRDVLRGIQRAETDRLPVIALLNCLADEATARPDTVRTALRELVRFGSALHREPSTPVLARGRYGADFRVESGKAFMISVTDLNPGDALVAAVWWQTVVTEDLAGYEQAAKQFVEMLNSPHELTRCEGALGFGMLCSKVQGRNRQSELAACKEYLRVAGPTVRRMAFDGTNAECCSALYALEMLGSNRIWTLPSLEIIESLFRLWRKSPVVTIRELAVRALAVQPLASRDGPQSLSIPSAELQSLFQMYQQLNKWAERPAVLVIAWYVRGFNDVELAKRARECSSAEPKYRPTLNELLEHLETNKIGS
jgi:hypothetical protein